MVPYALESTVAKVWQFCTRRVKQLFERREFHACEFQELDRAV
jgi:hypothetical protein